MDASWVHDRLKDRDPEGAERLVRAMATLDDGEVRRARADLAGKVEAALAGELSETELDEAYAAAYYRDRSPDEIRDIYVTRRVGGKWTTGVPVHADGWKIGACPAEGGYGFGDGHVRVLRQERGDRMGRVVHFEIHADDVDRAERFYTEVFGWMVEKFDGPIDYRLVNTGPKSQTGIDGALMERRHEVRGDGVIAYVCTIQVDDIGATEQRVKDAGGEPIASDQVFTFAKSEVPLIDSERYSVFPSLSDAEANALEALRLGLAPDAVRRRTATAAVGITVWCALQTALAGTGLLARFDWRPPPLALFFPLVIALAIGFGAQKALWAQKVAPRIVDRWLLRTGWSSQTTGEPKPVDAPDNLFETIRADPGAHGRFDAQAKSRTAWTTLRLHPTLATLTALGKHVEELRDIVMVDRDWSDVLTEQLVELKNAGGIAHLDHQPDRFVLPFFQVNRLNGGGGDRVDAGRPGRERDARVPEQQGEHRSECRPENQQREERRDPLAVNPLHEDRDDEAGFRVLGRRHELRSLRQQCQRRRRLFDGSRLQLLGFGRQFDRRRSGFDRLGNEQLGLRRRLDGQRRIGQKVVRAMHAALGRRFTTFLNGHGTYPLGRPLLSFQQFAQLCKRFLNLRGGGLLRALRLLPGHLDARDAEPLEQILAAVPLARLQLEEVLAADELEVPFQDAGVHEDAAQEELLLEADAALPGERVLEVGIEDARGLRRRVGHRLVVGFDAARRIGQEARPVVVVERGRDHAAEQLRTVGVLRLRQREVQAGAAAHDLSEDVDGDAGVLRRDGALTAIAIADATVVDFTVKTGATAAGGGINDRILHRQVHCIGRDHTCHIVPGCACCTGGSRKRICSSVRGGSTGILALSRAGDSSTIDLDRGSKQLAGEEDALHLLALDITLTICAQRSSCHTRLRGSSPFRGLRSGCFRNHTRGPEAADIGIPITGRLASQGQHIIHVPIGRIIEGFRIPLEYKGIRLPTCVITRS